MTATRTLSCLLLLTIAGAHAPLLAADATAVVCTAVENRAPVGAADRFPAAVGSLYCLSELHGVEGEVVHVWLHGDREVARITLSSRGERWRTWSKKTIPAAWTGAWRVEVRTGAGELLATVEFAVE